MIFVIISIITAIIVVIIFANKQIEPYPGYNQIRDSNEKKNKLVYYKRFDIDKYINPKEEDPILIAGIQHDSRLGICAACKPGEELMLVREPDNEFDKNAIMVVRFNGDVLGYIPKTSAEYYAPLLDNRVLIKTYFHFLHQVENWDDAYINVVEYTQ